MRDKLRLPHTDVGGGWLIFDLREGDFGFHPVDSSEKPETGAHDISFYCEDLEATVGTLKERGVEFDHEIKEAGYGFYTHFTMPGNVKVQLYEPKYVKRTTGAKTKSVLHASRTKKRRPQTSATKV